MPEPSPEYKITSNGVQSETWPAPLINPAFWLKQGLRIPSEDPLDPALIIRLEQGYSLATVVEKVQCALMAHEETARVYQRAHRLSRILRGAPAPRWLRRAAEAPVIVEADAAWLRQLAQRAATWERFDKRAKEWQPILPPREVIETLIALQEWLFPPLYGVIEAPTLRPDGSVLTTPGYDPETYLYLEPSCPFLAIPETPTSEDAVAALRVLAEPFCDFPFAAPHDRAAAIAAVLSLVCRATVSSSPVPLFGITATTRASGKGLLCDAIATIATGRAAPKWAPTMDQEEERKGLFTLALEGDPLVCMDNCLHPLGSPALDSALTATTLKGRILGSTASKETPMRMVFFATGNNLRYRGDLARRVVPIALDPQMERPEDRAGWKYPDLLDWIGQERAHLLVAALTIVKAYFVAGCPPQDVPPLGSFEGWSRIIREALIWVGAPDPCTGRVDIEAESDSDFEALETLLHAWQVCYPDDPVTLHQVGQDMALAGEGGGPPTKWDDLREALGGFDRRYEPGKSLNMKEIGKAFTSFQGRVIKGKRLVRAGKTRTNKVQWVLKMVPA
jgi:hypothetical protein